MKTPLKVITVTGAIAAVLGVATLASLKSANADYYNGGSYGSYGGGGYGGYGSYGSYGGGYGGGGSAPIISLELNEKESMNSSLRVAAREDRLRDMKHLVALGADVNGQSDAGDTALIYAARNCSPKIVDYLLNAKANANTRDHQGRTALMYAASDSCTPVVKLLLAVSDIDLDGHDRDGRTLRDYALYGAELEVGGPASETYVMIRNASRARHHRINVNGVLTAKNAVR